MLRLALINMPFSDWHRPSFALSQLATLARQEFPNEIAVEIHYLNQDFAENLGPSTYTTIAHDTDHLMTGIGDWVFRQIAFPGLTDNAEKYFRRYYAGPRWLTFRKKLIDFRDELEEHCLRLIDVYHLDTADVVGFTSMFAQTVSSAALARLIKERNEKVVTLLGGANCEVPMGAVIAKNFPMIDFVFSGPALDTFRKFLGYAIKGNMDSGHKITGILSRRNCQQRSFRTAIGGERAIDEFLEPDYESFESALKSRPILQSAQDDHTQSILYFETSRGCWWGERSHCTFCGLNGLSMNYRAMPPALAIEQLRKLFRFAPWCVNYHCTDNIMPRNYPRDVFPKLEAPAGVSIFYEVKLPLSEADLRAMAKAKVNKVQPGIEALATKTLALMGKGTTVFQNLQFLKNCRRYEIEPFWNLLIGFPGESETVYEKYLQDIPMLVHLQPPTGVFMVRFDRFSPYFADSVKYGLNLQPMDFYELIYPFAENDLKDLAYFFRDTNVSEYLVNAATWIGTLSGRISEWRNHWEKKEPPSLSLRREANGRWIIHDSRFANACTLDIDSEARALLRRLTSPAHVDRLAKEVGLPERTVSSYLALFREHKMLFDEDDRVMSLVLPDSVDLKLDPLRSVP